MNLPFEHTLDFKPNSEWYSDPFHLTAGQEIEVRAYGTGRFYVGVFAQVLVESRGSRTTGRPFPFRFGTDRQSFDYRFRAPVTGWYQLVVRLGMFNPPSRITFGLKAARW